MILTYLDWPIFACSKSAMKTKRIFYINRDNDYSYLELATALSSDLIPKTLQTPPFSYLALRTRFNIPVMGD
jgi:hypothetical protein